jgi:hypothetical protein
MEDGHIITVQIETQLGWISSKHYVDHTFPQGLIGAISANPSKTISTAAAKPILAARTSTGAAKHSKILAARLSAAIPIPNLASG